MDVSSIFNYPKHIYLTLQSLGADWLTRLVHGILLLTSASDPARRPVINEDYARVCLGGGASFNVKTEIELYLLLCYASQLVESVECAGCGKCS